MFWILKFFEKEFRDFFQRKDFKILVEASECWESSVILCEIWHSINLIGLENQQGLD